LSVQHLRVGVWHPVYFMPTFSVTFLLCVSSHDKAVEYVRASATATRLCSTHGGISASCCPIAGRNCDRPCVYATLRQHSDFGLAWPDGKSTQPSGNPLYFKPNWLGAGSHLAALSSRFGAVRSNEPNSWRGLNPCNSVLVQQFCPVVCLVTDSVNGIWSSLPQRHVAGVGG